MREQEFVQKLFGTPNDGVLYLNANVMKAAKLKPGDKLTITPEKEGFRVRLEGSHAGQLGKAETRRDRSDVSLDDQEAESSL